MTDLAHTLTAHLAAAFAAEGLDPALGRVVRSDQADFQCNGAMPADLRANPGLDGCDPLQHAGDVSSAR
jgi:arginyl-tRNA synthetase